MVDAFMAVRPLPHMFDWSWLTFMCPNIALRSLDLFCFSTWKLGFLYVLWFCYIDLLSSKFVPFFFLPSPDNSNDLEHYMCSISPTKLVTVFDGTYFVSIPWLQKKKKKKAGNMVFGIKNLQSVAPGSL